MTLVACLAVSTVIEIGSMVCSWSARTADQSTPTGSSMSKNNRRTVPSLRNFGLAGLVSAFTLFGCATPRMHSQDELNSASLACGLTYGELIQDDEEKKLLIMFRQAPSAAQRGCVYQWAKKRHLKLVVVDAISFPEEQ